MKTDRYENHHHEWREEENERKSTSRRNTDPFYPDTYFRQDMTPEREEQASE